ncbi:MAG: hypothetical protein JWN95_2056 [Frankiales bacterium]|nr:hypothetical protein [Frankiales bacterium]
MIEKEVIWQGRHVSLVDESELRGWVGLHGAPTLGRHDGHARLRGPFSAAGSLLRKLAPAIIAARPDLARRYDIEILAAAPEIGTLLSNSRPTLTSQADPATRTRYYPHNRANWIGNGLTDLVLEWVEVLGGNQSVVIEHVDDLDATDENWLSSLVRRADPARLRLILVGSTSVVRAGQAASPSSGGSPVPDDVELARRFVAGHCLSTEPAERSAYAAIEEKLRAMLHDAQASLLTRANEQSWRRGALAFHCEHGSDPTGVGVDALSQAQQTCLMEGFYDAVLNLGERIRHLLSWSADPERSWLATVKMTIALQAMGRPDEAMELFDDACANSTMPSVHMQSAYGRAMIYTRYYDEPRRDLRKAKGLINTAVALAGLSTDDQRRAYNRTFNENGLALVDMHLGELDAAVGLIEAGIERLDQEVEDGRFLLHRSVLRYNHAQLMSKHASLEQALAEYSQLVIEDPHHPDYWFDRAGLYEKAGRIPEAIADYTQAILAGPPYPEPYYNRAELRLRLGDADGALADFSRVLDLDPAFVDAWVNRASLQLDAGNIEAAEADIAAGLSESPDQPHLLCLRGLIQHEHGRLGAAQECFEAALAADPELAGAWANLGAVLYEQGDVVAARDCLQRSLALDENPDVRENLELTLAAAS